MIIPPYYERDDHGVPRGWIERMKRTIRTLGWRFNTDRMVIDYANSCYLPGRGREEQPHAVVRAPASRSRS